MNILQISTADKAGGAEKVAYDLFCSYRNLGHQSYLTVGNKSLTDPNIIEIPNDDYRNTWAKPWRKAQKKLQENQSYKAARIAGWAANMGELPRWVEWKRGIEDFNFPGIYHLIERLPEAPDIIHVHNLHGGYFDLRALTLLSQKWPIVVTLHDAWMLTGHCAYPIGCDRWKSGCGTCPDLSLYPAILKDATAYNWQRKQKIYQHSDPFIAAPCKWLLDMAQQSILKPVMGAARVIEYGIDLTVFRPADKKMVRDKLKLPQEVPIILFVGNRASKNPFKDVKTIERALQILAPNLNTQSLMFLSVGGQEGQQQLGTITLRSIGYQREPEELAQYYQASDIFVHAAHADNFPNTILEALACGIPVVATAVGGIPEQINSGHTGFLVPPEDGRAMADALQRIIQNTQMRQRMGAAASEIAKRRFDINKQVNSYLAWYEEILNEGKIQPRNLNPIIT